MKKHLMISALLCCTVIASAFELGKSDAVIYYNARNKSYAAELGTYLNKVFGKKYTLKAADKISALIKCVEEENAGNREFSKAKISITESIKAMNLPEADTFLKEFLPSYGLTIDELN